MKFNFNNTEYSTPSDLSEVTLSQAIELKNIIKTIPLQDLHSKAAILINLYTGIDIAIIKTQMDISQVINIYRVWHEMMNSSEEETRPKAYYEWHNEVWYLSSPASSFSEEIMKHEFSILKELSKAIIRYSNGDWSVMPIICAAYLRKLDEPLKMEIFTDPLNETVKQMECLPMDIVIAIGKFLKETLDVFNSINIKSD